MQDHVKKKRGGEEGPLVETFENPGLKAVGVTPCLETAAVQRAEAVFTAKANPTAGSGHRTALGSGGLASLSTQTPPSQ